MKTKELQFLLAEYQIDTELNDTSKFLLPTVILNSNTGRAFPIEKLKEYGFVNAYINDLGTDLLNYSWYTSSGKFLFLLFTPSYDHSFNSTERNLINFSNWVDYYNLDEQGKLVIHVFRIDERYYKDITHFYKGEYSKFSNDLKTIYTSETIRAIVKKEQWFKERQERLLDITIPEHQEYYSIMNPEKEILRYNLRYELAEKIITKLNDSS